LIFDEYLITVDENSKIYDLTFLKKVSGEDEKFILDMVQTFRSMAPDALKRMETYLAQERYEALSREAHRFIPGISFLGVRNIEAEMVIIEEYSKNCTELDKLPDLFASVKEKIDKLIHVLISDFRLES
jgi:HPt (histidine-containing phosphotransfer) domain-containing protein